MMSLTKFAREVSQASHYRRRPIAALRYAYAKWIFRRHRQTSAVGFLQGLGIDVDRAFLGFSKWRSQMESVVSAVQKGSGGHGGISFDDGRILFALVRALRPDYVIETGVAAGVSTTFLGAALVENGCGRLYSIELPPGEASRRALADGSLYAWHERGVGWAIPDELKSVLGQRHRLILQDVRTALPGLLDEIPYVDVFFHDDLHTPDHMYWEYGAVWAKLRPRGVLVSDDANHGWIKFCVEKRLYETAFHNIDRLCVLRKPRAELAAAK